MNSSAVQNGGNDVQSYGMASVELSETSDRYCITMMREIDEAEPSTIRRRLAALSRLFKHLKQHHHVKTNPVATPMTSTARRFAH